MTQKNRKTSISEMGSVVKHLFARFFAGMPTDAPFQADLPGFSLKCEDAQKPR
jgi:hypothetical protein